MEEERKREEAYMRRALVLAEKGRGWTSPNPMVGAVIVREDGAVIGEGYHERYGDLHAERNALKNCTESPRGATMYVTLEPCCHHGKQPPCVDAILEAGIRRVVVGSGDPNPKVAGKGIRILRGHGVEVSEGVLEEECNAINEVFFHFIRTGTPFVAMKYAMTMDGKIAAYTGRSQWVTGEAARAHVQTLRHAYRGIMAGVGTVLADDPQLTCRIPGGRSPVRIICDTHLKTPPSSNVVRTAGETPTVLVTCCEDPARAAPYLERGCRILRVGSRDGRPDLMELMHRLGAEGMDSILLEGGSILNWSALRSGIVRKVYTYIAPKIFGGDAAKGPVGGRGVPDPQGAWRLSDSRISQLGEDLLIESRICAGDPREQREWKRGGLHCLQES